MSITDASTNLDTAYTEQSTVAFNAGTLSTITACTNEVQAKIKRGTLSASSTPTLTQVQNWIIRGKQVLMQYRGFTYSRRYATVDTVASQFRYALPPDYAGGKTVLRDLSNDRSIPLWDAHWYDTKYPDPSEEASNEPRVGCVKNMELWLAPPPNAVYSLELEYDRSGDDNTTTDISYLPEADRFLICDYATSESFESLHDFEKAVYYRNKWEAGVGFSVKADGKRKWKKMNFRCISHIEEYSAMNYQNNNR